MSPDPVHANPPPPEEKPVVSEPMTLAQCRAIVVGSECKRVGDYCATDDRESCSNEGYQCTDKGGTLTWEPSPSRTCNPPSPGGD
jgi:hypothetical protein